MGPSSSEKWQLPPDVNWTLEIGKHLGVSVRETKWTWAWGWVHVGSRSALHLLMWDFGIDTSRDRSEACFSIFKRGWYRGRLMECW